MDQQDRNQRRDQEINKLENEVQQIQNDMLFAQNNKELMFEIFKPKEKQRRKLTEPNGSSDEQNQDLTDCSSHRVASKKQFSGYEYQVQNHQFTEKYFDKVYLELCGFSDLQSGKFSHLEKQMSNYESKRPATNKNASNYENKHVDQNQEEITGSVIFFERRCDQPPRKEKYSIVNLDSAYQTRELIEKLNQSELNIDEYILNQGSLSQSKHQTVDERYLNESSVNKNEFDKNFGNDEQRRKREEMRAENQRLVDDFDQVLDELINQRKTASSTAFYEAINEFNYDKKQLDTALYKDHNGSFQVAQSPTKRLICMKNSSIEHYKHIRERNLMDKSEEKPGRVYMASPERSYVVKQEQQIDYELAFRKNPLKFYDEALNAPITKHKIQQQRPSLSPRNGNLEKQSTLGSVSSHSMSQKNMKTLNQLSTARKSSRRDYEAYTIVSKQTTRPHNRINQKIKSKIQQKLADKLGSHLTQQVLQALEEANLQEAINDIISQNSNLVEEPDERESDRKHSKKMSLKSQQNQCLEDVIRENSSQNSQSSGRIVKANGRNQNIPGMNDNESEHQQRDQLHIQIERKQKAQTSQVSHRSGASSKYYHSENNANTEEDARVNRAY